MRWGRRRRCPGRPFPGCAKRFAPSSTPGARRLDEVALDYLFCDASHFAVHPDARAEPVLAACGITTAGKPVLIGLEVAANEGNDAWDDFLDGLTQRGLRPPLLVISDGAAGLVGGIDRKLPRSLRQRCLIHRSRTVLAKIPKHARAEVKAASWAMFDIPADATPGEKAEALVQQRIQAFAATYNTAYPAAVRCRLVDRQALTVYLRFPPEHWQRTRPSTLIERPFGQTRRRTKVIGRLPTETSCVSLVWAVLDRASRGRPGFNITATATRLLQDLRRQLLDPPTRSADTPPTSTNPPPPLPNIDHGAASRRHLHRSRAATSGGVRTRFPLSGRRYERLWAGASCSDRCCGDE